MIPWLTPPVPYLLDLHFGKCNKWGFLVEWPLMLLLIWKLTFDLLSPFVS